MIVFDLRCSNGHVFEAWFGSSDAFETQRSGGLVVCAICGDADVAKAVMAPNVAAKGNRGGDAPAPAAAMKAALAAIASAQAEALKTSTWVGPDFATRARAMHDGTVDHAPIHGQATRAEAKALVEDGVAVAPLIVPVVPPETLN
ncbi:DUF1178 family protein [Sphingomonas sp. RS2018]